MARRPVFVSFCYKDDVFRVQEILKMGLFDGQPLLSTNDFETVKRKGSKAIQNWIDDQMKFKQCLIVLVGQNTADRPWVQYEIKKADADGRAIFGIYIHNMKDVNGYSRKGKDPFVIVFGYKKYKMYDTPDGSFGTMNAYNYIENNITNWIEIAVASKNNSNFF